MDASRHFDGLVTAENIEEVAEAARRLLSDKTFTLIEGEVDGRMRKPETGLKLYDKGVEVQDYGRPGMAGFLIHTPNCLYPVHGHDHDTEEDPDLKGTYVQVTDTQLVVTFRPASTDPRRQWTFTIED